MDVVDGDDLRQLFNKVALLDDVDSPSDHRVLDDTIVNFSKVSSPPKPARSLSDLPEDILDQIAELVHGFGPLEADEIRRKRWRFYLRSPYQPRSISNTGCVTGILNSFQSFASTNRKIYGVCLPCLWQRIQLPTSIPCPIDFWLQTILPKHGTLIRELRICISPSCRELSSDPTQARDPSTDNTFTRDVDSDYLDQPLIPELMSMETVMKLLKTFQQIPHLEVACASHPHPSPSSDFFDRCLKMLKTLIESKDRLGVVQVIVLSTSTDSDEKQKVHELLISLGQSLYSPSYKTTQTRFIDLDEHWSSKSLAEDQKRSQVMRSD